MEITCSLPMIDLVQIIVATGGLIALLWSLKQTRDAIRLQDIRSRQQLRGYMGLSGVAILKYAPNGKTEGIVLDAIAQNFGATPVKVILSYSHRMELSSKDLIKPHYSIDSEQEKFPQSCGPSAGFSFANISVSEDLCKKIHEKKLRSFILLYLEYEDIFKENNIEKFCFEILINHNFFDDHPGSALLHGAVVLKRHDNFDISRKV